MKKILILLFIIVFHNSFAQIPGEKQVIREAIRLFSLHDYFHTISLLNRIIKNDKNNDHINYLLGVSYLKTGKVDSAIYYLNMAKDNISYSFKEFSPTDKKAPVEVYMYLAEAYHKKYKFDKALNFNKKYLDKAVNPDTFYVNRQIKSIKYAKEATKDSIQIKITNLGSAINTKYNEYAPAIDSSQTILVFTSRRKGNFGEITDYGDYPSDIYISFFKNGKWTKAKNLGKTVNTVNNEASVSLAAGAKHLFIFKSEKGNGNLYETYFVDSLWTKPEKLPYPINTKYNETHASITADEDILYFVSDRPGGYGGKDIYYCVALPNGEWSKPKNIGPVINTPYDEDAVFVHPDGRTLYFSSKGHDNLGGYDIFYSNKKEDGTWGKPHNFGYPINTPFDENFFVITPDNKAAYFSAIKPGGYGMRDIYKMDFLSLPGRYETVLKGFVVSEADNGNIVKDAVLEVYDKNGNFLGRYKPNKKGEYFIILRQGKNYTISAKYNGKQIKNKIAIPDNTSYFLTGKPYRKTPLLIIN